MSEADRDPVPALWRAAPPAHWDARVPWWVKVVLLAAATVAAVLWADLPAARWALREPRRFWDLGNAGAPHGDVARDLMMLEQFGQWTSAIVIIIAVGLLDRAGRRKALAIAIGCLITVGVTHLLKDCVGRNRPYVLEGAEKGMWLWGGPAKGFTGGAKWGAFPSAHASGAFALAAGLAWFYPRGRALFMALACVTAAQRVLHAAHYVSDVIAGMAVGVGVVRTTLHLNVAGRLIALMPPTMRAWWMSET